MLWATSCRGGAANRARLTHLAKAPQGAVLQEGLEHQGEGQGKAIEGEPRGEYKHAYKAGGDPLPLQNRHGATGI